MARFQTTALVNGTHNPKDFSEKGYQFAKGNQVARKNKGQIRGRNFLTQHLISRLQERDPKDKRKRSYYAKIIDRIVDLAALGDHHAYMFIFERIEGKPRQQLDVQLEAPITRIDRFIIRPGDDAKLISEQIRAINHAPEIIENDA